MGSPLGARAPGLGAGTARPQAALGSVAPRPSGRPFSSTLFVYRLACTDEQNGDAVVQQAARADQQDVVEVEVPYRE